MSFKQFFKNVDKVFEPYLKVLVPYLLAAAGIVLILGLLWQYVPFSKSLRNIVYSFRITGSFKAILINVVILCVIFASTYLLSKHIPKRNEDDKIHHTKTEIVLFKVLILLVLLNVIEGTVVVVASLSAHPILGNHAISLVHDYDSKNSIPSSDMALGWSHNDFITAEFLTKKSENYLVYSLNGYENMQVGLWAGIPFMFHKNIQYLEQVPEYVPIYEKALTYLNKTLYVVYDLKGEPKLLIFKPEVLKKHVKLIPKSTAGSMEVGAVLILDVEETVQQENIKPVKL